MEKKNRRGKGFSKGTTKMEIISFLANGKKDKQEVIRHVKKNLRIKQTRGIDKHISDLTKEGLIAKELKRGYPTKLRLNDDYFAFKIICNLYFENNRILELLTADYYINYISKCDFYIESTKEIISTFREPLHMLISKEHQSLRENTFFELLLRHMEDKDVEILHEIIGDLFNEYQQVKSLRTMEDNIPTRDLLMELSFLIYPRNQRVDIRNLLLCSPSCLKLIFSIPNKQQISADTLFLSYYHYYIGFMILYLKGIDPRSIVINEKQVRKRGKFNKKSILLENLSKEINELSKFINVYQQNSPSKQNIYPVPILSICQSLLMADFYSSNIHQPIWFYERHNYILIEKFFDYSQFSSYKISYHNKYLFYGHIFPGK